MVRATKVGKPRPFALGLLLTIVTVGIYSYYWRYKAHSELYKQFDLEDEGRNEGIVWLILGIIFGVLMLVYDWMFTSNVKILRERLGVHKGIGPGAWLTLQIVGSIVLVVGLFMLIYGLPIEDNPKTDRNEERDATPGLIWGGVSLVVVAMVALAVGYYVLQTSINEIWGVFDQRMGQLAASAPPTAWQPPPRV